MTNDPTSLIAAEIAERDRTAKALGWQRLLDVIAGHSPGAWSASRVRGLRPFRDSASAKARGESVTLMGLSREQGQTLPAAGLEDLDPLLDAVRRGHGLAASELAALLPALRAEASLREFLREHGELPPRLVEIATIEADLGEMRKAFARCLEPNGRIADSADPELKKARQGLRSGRRRLLNQATELARQFADVLQESRPIERDERFVLPVRADAHRRVDGIVLGSSSTGATLFVEPPRLTKLANDLAVMRGTVEQIEARVVAALNRLARDHIEGLTEAVNVLVDLDVLHALDRYGTSARATIVEMTDDAMIDLRDLRHPLLVAADENVIPCDVRLAGGHALVVSGPNAGGKTVTLKAVGLAAWLSAAGLPVPVDPSSKIGWFTDVFADIGDQQSLERSLSTFSAHVSHLAEILKHARQRSLVLLDELAGATDPEEGSALAVAVIEQLTAQGAAVMVSTHYQSLKSMAARHEHIENAAVGFDFERMRPTFRLHAGAPGASSALAVAERFGLPSAVLARARVALPETAQERERLLAALDRERTEAQTLIAKNSELKDALEQARRAVERQLAHLKDRDRREVDRETEELLTAVRQARRDLDGAKKRLAKMGKNGTTRQEVRKLEREVDDAASLATLGGPLERKRRGTDQTRADSKKAAPIAVSVGDTVMLTTLRKKAQVLAIGKDGELQVRVGAFTLRATSADIRAVSSGGSAAGSTAGSAAGVWAGQGGDSRGGRKAAKRAQSEHQTPADKKQDDNTCDLRGMRVDEALTEIDAFVDACLRAGHVRAFVLHGHGTGALKSAVREHLKLHGSVSSARSADTEEGGDAWTICRF